MILWHDACTFTKKISILMKKIALLSIFAGALFFTACNNGSSDKDRAERNEMTIGEEIDGTIDESDARARELRAEDEAKLEESQKELEESEKDMEKDRKELKEEEEKRISEKSSG